MPAETRPGYTVVGTTDETTQCDCCGRTNLKMTVVLRDPDNEFVFYGRNCAARATGWRAAHLDRQVYTAQAATDRARATLAHYQQFLGTAGVDLFIARNPHIYTHRTSWGEIENMIAETIAEATAVLAPLNRTPTGA